MSGVCSDIFALGDGPSVTERGTTLVQPAAARRRGGYRTRGVSAFLPFAAVKIKDWPRRRDGLRDERPFVCVCRTSEGCVRRYRRRRRAGCQDGRSRRAIVRSRAAASGGSSTTRARSSGRGSAAGVPDSVPCAGGFAVSRPGSGGCSTPRGGTGTAALPAKASGAAVLLSSCESVRLSACTDCAGFCAAAPQLVCCTLFDLRARKIPWVYPANPN